MKQYHSFTFQKKQNKQNKKTVYITLLEILAFNSAPLSVTQLNKHLKVMHGLHTVDVTECDLNMWQLPLHIQPARTCERKQNRI